MNDISSKKGRYNVICCLVAWMLINQRVTARNRNSSTGVKKEVLLHLLYLSICDYLVTNISFSEFSKSLVTTIPSL